MTEEIEKSLRKDGISFLWDEEEEVYIGKILADVSSDGDYLDNKTIKLEEVTSVIDKLKNNEQLKNANLGVHMGTRAS